MGAPPRVARPAAGQAAILCPGRRPLLRGEGGGEGGTLRACGRGKAGAVRKKRAIPAPLAARAEHAQKNAPGAAAAGGGTRARRQQPETTPTSASSLKAVSGLPSSAASSSAGVGSFAAAETRNRRALVGTPHSNFSHARAATSATSVQPSSCTLAKASSSKAVSLTRLMKAYCARGKGVGAVGGPG